MGKWIVNECRVFDNRDGWTAKLVDKANAERAKERHNADVTELEERILDGAEVHTPAMTIRTSEILNLLDPGEPPCQCIDVATNRVNCPNVQLCDGASTAAGWCAANETYQHALAISEGRTP